MPNTHYTLQNISSTATLYIVTMPLPLQHLLTFSPYAAAEGPVTLRYSPVVIRGPPPGSILPWHPVLVPAAPGLQHPFALHKASWGRTGSG